MAEKEYIEREAAISSLDELEKTSYHNSVLWPDHVEECREALRSVPAADVRPVVKARWIHMPSDGKFRDTCVCSACKKSPPIESWVVQGFNACPYCFADMREES